MEGRRLDPLTDRPFDRAIEDRFVVLVHPPFGFALFYLRGVAPPSVKSSAIYWGAIPWVVLQLIMVGIVIAWPGLVTGFLDQPVVFDPADVQIDIPTIDESEPPPIDIQ